MWTRKELKDKAKISFRANYWKSVLVALILVALAGGMSWYSSAVSVPAASPTPSIESYSDDDVNVSVNDGRVTVDVGDHDGSGGVHVDVDADDAEELAEALDDITHDVVAVDVDPGFWPAMALVSISMLLIILVIGVIIIAVYAFVFNPLEVGAQRFFVRNLNQKAEVKEVAFAYDNNYIETVKTVFLRDLFIFLWSLLLIIPGIYKSYEYRMIPYLLAEDPTMTKDRAFAESKRMMDGQKWNAFVLDLSFLGWNILSLMTLGILGIFYVCPYQAQTNAALYEKLRYGMPAPEQAGWTAQPAQTMPVSSTIPATTQPMQSAPNAAASASVATVPVIATASQPPIPPFAAVGYEPDEDDSFTEASEESGEVLAGSPVEAGAENSADQETPDSPEA